MKDLKKKNEWAREREGKLHASYSFLCPNNNMKHKTERKKWGRFAEAQVNGTHKRDGVFILIDGKIFQAWIPTKDLPVRMRLASEVEGGIMSLECNDFHGMCFVKSSD